MSNLSRRQLLIFFGSSAAATALAPTVSEKLLGGTSSAAIAQETRTPTAAPGLGFTPLRLANPLEIYTELPSYQPTGIGQGSILPAGNAELSSYQYFDDVIVPPEYERYVIVRWGDNVFPNPEEYFGYNCDFLGFVPVSRNSTTDGYLFVNHEYVSWPISYLAPETSTDLLNFPSSFQEVIGFPLPEGTGANTGARLASLTPAEKRLVYGEFQYNQGVSVVRIRKQNDKFAVVSDSKNRRIHGLSGLGINSTRTDGYQSVTSWGTRSYQQGDQNYLIGTGPAATEVFNLSSDGLGNKIIGTAFNCSGGVSPWGTTFSAEENFQAGSPSATSTGFFVGVQEGVKPDGTQTGYLPGTTGAEFGQVGEKYGWMVEVDPADPNFRPRKHTWLGRYRHENIAFRAKVGQRLVAYLGDDRRGGGTFKFVSNGRIRSLTDRDANSRLLEDGVLYIAKFNPNGTGEWIPMLLNTATNPIPPSVIGSGTAPGSGSRVPFIRLPRRNGVAGQTVDGGFFSLLETNEAAQLPDYQNKKLSDFYTSQGAILSDAFPAGMLVGGTPTARPEDIEVHPYNNQVFIAYTDGAPGSDGYPDSRIFVVAKDGAAINDTQQFGGIYKIVEQSEGGVGTRFRWEVFAQAGEEGAEAGYGFANVDNLAFDPQANVWGVTDMSTGLHNGFGGGAAAAPLPISHTATTASAASTLVGCFGNNSLFYIPTQGANAGKFVPFAYGPPRCEMTGPYFVGNTLLIAVQHPCEDAPIGDGTLLSRSIEMLNLSGNGLFQQTRTVPRGSNWPSNIEGNPTGAPKPSVIGIRPRKSFGEGNRKFTP